MENQKTAYSAMYLSVVFFLVIGFLHYYVLIVYRQLDNVVIEMLYRFLSGFKPLKQPYFSKLLLIMLITGAVMIYTPRKKTGLSLTKGFALYASGCSFLMLSDLINISTLAAIYFSMALYMLGFIFTLSGALQLFQFMNYKNEAKDDPFNDENERFIQMEERIDTPYSVNIPYEYRYKNKVRKGWINFVNLFRSLLIIGTPGSGKSFAFIEEIIEQLINKRFALLIYDFKFDTLSKIAYNYWMRKKEEVKKDSSDKGPPLPEFYMLCFDNVEKSHRCNPINPYLLQSQTDASDAATIIMKNLNREWIKRNDFFSKSAISFVSGLIWYLKNKSEENGQNLCTLPHVITLSTVNIEYLLKIMLQDLEVRSLMIPFKDALEREAVQQLAGQTASAQISLSMLANKEIYYIMTGNDFQLDLNNPNKPKIVCIQNNPDRSEIYSAPIGLYVNKILQVVNKPGGRPLGLILDELPTIFIMGLRKIIDTGRSHYVATILGIQSITQLIADYGKEMAEVIFDNCSNVFSGAAKGETARRISEIFGKIHQEKKALTISKNDTSTNISTVLSEVLPKNKITGMSTGYFGGIVADTFEHRITNKLCYGLLKPNMESKKIQGKYDTPIIHKFKLPNHNQLVRDQLELMKTIGFYKAVEQLDFGRIDYIDFYNEYLEKFSLKAYPDEEHRMKFIPMVRKLKLFDHLQHLEAIVSKKGDSLPELESFFLKLVDRMFVTKEIDRKLNENFIEILKDIDKLVQTEYHKCTGKNADSAIFDKKKVTGELDDAISQNSTLSDEFDYEYDQLATAQMKDQKYGSPETATFDKNEAADDNLLFAINNEDGNHFYSSFPVDHIQE